MPHNSNVIFLHSAYDTFLPSGFSTTLGAQPAFYRHLKAFTILGVPSQMDSIVFDIRTLTKGYCRDGKHLMDVAVCNEFKNFSMNHM